MCKYCNREHNEIELCKPTRRSFFFLGLASLAAVAVGQVDLKEIHPWVYKPALTETQILAIELQKLIPGLKTLFERDDVFYSAIKDKLII